jgi:hypothetical protein
MVANAGPVIIFMCLLVLQAILGFLFGSYASRGFLLVLEETAAGNDEVVWTREPMTDWFAKLFYLLWIAGVWLVPTWLVLRWLRPAFLGDELGLQFVVVSVAVVWLMFPVSLLSSLAAGTPWAVLYPPLLGRLARHPGAVLGLYGSTVLLLAGSAGLFYLVMKGWASLFIPVAAMAAAAVFLIYARLLGRVARIVNQQSAAEAEEADEPKPRKRRKARSATGAEVVDPWAVPKEKPRPPKRKRGTYGIKDYEPTPEAAPEVPAGEVYGLQAPPPVAPPPPPSIWADDEPAVEKAVLPEKPTREEEMEQREEPPLPAWPLVQGVYSFPWYRGTVGAWGLIALGLLIMGVVLRAMIEILPRGGD